MNTYSSYKDSGVEWIGEVPSEWECLRGRFLFENKKIINKEFQCENLLSLTLFGVLNKNMESHKGLRPSNYKTYQLFEKDDLVFKLIDLENVKTSRVGLVHENGIMSPVYIRLEPNKNSHSKYNYYYFYDLYKKEIFNFLGSGVRSSLSPSDLLEIEVPVPPLQEQQQISDYLDYKTLKIDTLIEKTEQKIELLKEQRTSLINTTVTKGLNPNVEMKDSGVEWIGEIPSKWKTTRLKYIFKLREEKTDTGEGELLTVTITKGIVRRRDFIKKGDHLSRSKSLKGYKVCYTNDLVNNIMKMGFRCLGISDYNGIVSPAYSVFSFINNKNKPMYWDYLLRTDLYVTEYKKRSKGIQESRMRLYDDYFLDIVSIVPPHQEQQQIVDYLDKENSKLDKLIDIESKRIKLLKEYRQSLISDVVTGKVDVRDEVLG